MQYVAQYDAKQNCAVHYIKVQHKMLQYITAQLNGIDPSVVQ